MPRTSPIFKIALLVFLFLLSLVTFAQNPGAIKESAKAAHMRQLNNQILTLHAQIQTVPDASSRRQLRGQAFQVLKTRQLALIALMRENPKAALTFAFSQEALDELSTKFPESDVFLEEHVRTMGEVEHWIADYPNNRAESMFLLKAGDRPWRLHFVGPDPNVSTGDVLDITGVLVGTDVAVEESAVISISSTTTSPPHQGRSLIILFGGMLIPLGGIKLFKGLHQSPQGLFIWLTIAILTASSPLSMYAQSTCSTNGTQNVAVLLVTFPGVTIPSNITQQSLSDMFFSTTSASLDGYWKDASYGQAGARGSVTGPYTLTGSYTCSNISQLISDAISAAAANGIDFNSNNRVSIVFPNLSPSCGWAGLSSMGCYSVSTPAGTFNISTSVLDWNDLTSSYAVKLIDHESGHQLGLAHSRLRQFGTEVLGPVGTTGTLTEYGDHFSAMGYPNLGHYTAEHKAEILGWLSPSNDYQVVQSGGTFTLQPYELASPGLKALKVQRGSNNNNAWLWIEYRQPNGLYDSTIPSQSFSGALIHYEDSITGPQTDLLDFTAPLTYSDNPALAVGQSWKDPYSDLSLSVISATSAGMTININYSGTVTCTHVSPTLSVSPLDPSIYPGNTTTYGLTITNNDSAGCSAATFNMGSTQPAGWPTSFSSTSITLTPGQSSSVTMNKTGPSGTAPGTYPVDASASNSTYVGSGAANVTVMTQPAATVTISVPSSSYTRKSTVPITATVLNGGTPVSGASVVFTLTRADGSVTTSKATTGTKGTATWNYKLSPKYPAGTYSVAAQATLSSTGTASSQAVTSNTVTFTVQ